MVAKRAFTLIELLVVIAIIAILAAVLFPVFASAKQKGNQTRCMNNMTQIGKAMVMYADDYAGYTPFAWNKINWSIWDSDTWRERLQGKYTKNRAVFQCPVPTAKPPDAWKSDKEKVRYIGHYGINVYITMDDTATSYIGYRLISTIPKPARTILVTENIDGDWSGEPHHNGNTGSAGQFYPYHGDKQTLGGEFVFCDGHAGFMSVSKTEGNNFWYWKIRK